jgi:hypothetical protein
MVSEKDVKGHRLFKILSWNVPTGIHWKPQKNSVRTSLNLNFKRRLWNKKLTTNSQCSKKLMLKVFVQA